MRSAALASRDCVADSCAHSLSVTASAVELAPAVVEERALGGGRLGRMRGGVALLRRLPPCLPAVGHLARERRESAERVDEVALRGGFAERLVRVLAVDRDEPRAELGELRERGGTAVDPRAAPALRVEHAPQQQLVAVAAELVLGEPRAHGRRVGDVELRRELRAVAARAQLAQFEAVAQQQAERVEQDRLAGARLAGQHGEPAGELDVESRDDDEIADRERTQHGTGGRRRARKQWRAVARVSGRERRLQSPGSGELRSGTALQCSFSRSIAK